MSGNDDSVAEEGQETSQLSRRGLLGAAAATGGAAAALVSNIAKAQSAKPSGEMVHIDKSYRALVRRTVNGPAKIETVKLLPFGGRQVLVRTTAVQCSYGDSTKVLGPVVWGGEANRNWPAVCGHAGLGVVEAVGPDVRGVKVGDKVFVSTTAQCGWCYNCIRGRSDACQANNNMVMDPVAVCADGLKINQEGYIGGTAEYTVAYEERLTPYFSNMPVEQVAMLISEGSTGLAMTNTMHPIEAGSTVVVFGCGPIGLSAIQGARIQGASHIVAVEPIAVRRELALKLGANEAVDPNKFDDDKLVPHLRGMTKGSSDRLFAGGNQTGPDYVIEAVGRDRFEPKVEKNRDRTGLIVMQQAYDLIARAGWGFFCGTGHQTGDMVKLDAATFTNGTKSVMSCQNGGTNSRRDLPRFIRLMESGKYDAKAMISNVHKFDDWQQAWEEVAYRTAVANIITFG